MSYAIKERLYRAYQNIIDFYKDMMYRIKNPDELSIFGEGGDSGGDSVYIRRPDVAAEWFKINFKRLKQNAVRVTPQNFHILFPQNQPVQLSLDLEGRLGKESSPNNPT